MKYDMVSINISFIDIDVTLHSFENTVFAHVSEKYKYFRHG